MSFLINWPIYLSVLAIVIIISLIAAKPATT